MFILRLPVLNPKHVLAALPQELHWEIIFLMQPAQVLKFAFVAVK